MRPIAHAEQDLLAAVAEHIGAVGLAKVTVASSAEACGVSPATLVKRFGSFQDCLHAAFKWHWHEFLRSLTERVSDGQNIDALIAGLGGVWHEGGLASLHLEFVARCHREREWPQGLDHELAEAAGQLGLFGDERTSLLESVWIGAMASWRSDLGDLPGHVMRQIKALADLAKHTDDPPKPEEEQVSMRPDPIRIVTHLNVSPATAFEMMTEGLGNWWPADYSWSGDELADIYIEPVTGGRCIELSQSGDRKFWGTVVDCEPEQNLTIRWQINGDRSVQKDPAHASRVSMVWQPEGEGLRFTLVHNEFSRHPGDPQHYRAGLASPAGWPLLVRRYQEACNRRGT